MVLKQKNRRTGLLCLLLAFMTVFLVFFAGCGNNQTNMNTNTDGLSVAETAETVETEAEDSQEDLDDAQLSELQEETDALIDADGVYTSKEDVALYINTYHRLPENFMTKKEAKALGWTGGSLEEYAEGKCIGGDRFGNYEGLLPEGETYYECDIDTLGRSKRGAKRIIYTEDGKVYYTEDHYESFVQLY